MKPTIKLIRFYSDNNETLGFIKLFTRTIFTLELPWKDNIKFVSCIPAGKYDIKFYSGTKHKSCLKILKVPNRTDILVHSGNYYTNTEGCMLVGFGLADINKDHIIDVTDSINALKYLRHRHADFKAGFHIEIIDAFNGKETLSIDEASYLKGYQDCMEGVK